jgi:hypothetical protein
MKVSRGSFMGNPDYMFVTGEYGELAWHGSMQSGGLLHQHSAEEARSCPWFFTGSPYGANIIGLAWERHAALQKQSK